MGVAAVVGLVAAPLMVLVVAAGPAGASPITDEGGFRSAFDTASQIDLGTNITLTCQDGVGSGDAVRSTGGSAVVLNGHGFAVTQTCAGSRVLSMQTSDALTLENVTITGGSVNHSSNCCGTGGGGVQTDAGALTVMNSAIVNNATCEHGGGIEMDKGAPLTITNSTIANNTAVEDGGGVRNPSGSHDITVTNSTISNNTGGNIGGIEADGGNVILTYATVADNTVNPAITCTIVSPESVPKTGANENKDQGVSPSFAAVTHPANIRTNDTATEHLVSIASVIALPHGGPDCGNFSFPTTQPLAKTTSQGFNFSDDSSCDLTGGTDKQSAGDPNLGALANNFPLTVTMPPPTRQTRLPLTGSPLLDAIPDPGGGCPAVPTITTDERSVTRPQGSGCDIGAVEVEVVAPAPVVITPKFTG